MPGVGKSTIADQVLNSLREQQSRHFICVIKLVVGQTPDIRALLISAWQHPGWPSSRRLPDVLSKKTLFNTRVACNELATRCGDGALLLLLDDVWSIEHLEQLDFATVCKASPTSRALITTRTCDSLPVGVPEQLHTVNVPILEVDAARQLLCLHAFGSKAPPAGQRWDAAVTALVAHSKCLPLTLTVCLQLTVKRTPARGDDQMALNSEPPRGAPGNRIVCGNAHAAKLSSLPCHRLQQLGVGSLTRAHVICPLACRFWEEPSCARHLSSCVQVLGRAVGADLACWHEVIEALNARRTLSSGVAGGDSIRDICEPSYEALSLSLKRCFVSFCAYPEDDRIPTVELAALWATFETVAHHSNIETARGRLDTLIAACLVQRDAGGYCFMHDVLRELAAAHAHEWCCYFHLHQV